MNEADVRFIWSFAPAAGAGILMLIWGFIVTLQIRRDERRRQSQPPNWDTQATSP